MAKKGLAPDCQLFKSRKLGPGSKTNYSTSRGNSKAAGGVGKSGRWMRLPGGVSIRWRYEQGTKASIMISDSVSDLYVLV